MSKQIADDSTAATLTRETLLSPICPLCHTLDHTVTADSLGAGAYWACTRCGQTWSAARLARAAAYAEYEATH
jgi:ribosomal protein L37AE/L43A